MVIVSSAAEPRLKPGLIDRYMITAEKGEICGRSSASTKSTSIELADLQPLVGVFSRMGYRVLLVSATSSFGIERLRRRTRGPSKRGCRAKRRGQNVALECGRAGTGLRVAAVSEETQKGKHTTTAARCCR